MIFEPKDDFESPLEINIGQRIGSNSHGIDEHYTTTNNCRKQAIDRRLQDEANYTCSNGECHFYCHNEDEKPNIASIRCSNKGRWRIPAGLGKLRHHQSIHCGDGPSQVINGRTSTGPCGTFTQYNRERVNIPECDRNRKKCSFRKGFMSDTDLLYTRRRLRITVSPGKSKLKNFN